MRSISETEADEPSRGRRIFQQKNICDRVARRRREDGIVSVSTLVLRPSVVLTETESVVDSLK